jgi:hypothetical protein
MSVGPLDRIRMWCLRHPLRAGLLAALLSVLSVAAWATDRIMRQDAYVQRAALVDNGFNAPFIAKEVHRELDELGLRVKKMAGEQSLQAALQKPDGTALERFCWEHYESGKPFFTRVFVEDTHGTTLARWPRPEKGDEDFLGKNYSWRDYFIGATSKSPGKPYYVSRTYVSESHHRLMFVISVPVYSAEGEWLGVLAAAVVPHSMLGPLLKQPDASHHAITLVSRLDKVRGQDLPHPYQYAVVFHDQSNQEQPLLLAEDLGRQIQQALSEPPPPRPGPLQPGTELKDYLDPVSHQREIAAFAPVKDTWFVVIVQTRDQVALADDSWWSLPFILGP